LEALPDAWAENRPSDYALELALVTEDLTAAASQLDAINKHPAFRMTPEQHQAAIVSKMRIFYYLAAQLRPPRLR
jgi:hypothetical protein